MAKGRIIIKQKRAPTRKRDVVIKKKGRAYFFSLPRRPGAINLHISKNITGELKIKALINDIFICIQTASAGARKTSFIFELLFGVKMIKGLFKEK